MQHFIGLMWKNIRYYNIFSFSLDAVFGSIVMLLMMERYNKWYLKLVFMFNKSKCFCCFKRFVEFHILRKVTQDSKILTSSTTHRSEKSPSNSGDNSVIAKTTSRLNIPNTAIEEVEESIDTKTQSPVLNRHKTFEDCEKEYTITIQVE